MKTVTCPFCETKFPPRSNYTDSKYEEQSSHQVSVESFMKLGGQEVPPSPCIPSLEVRRLRAKLILEEALETVRGLGFEACFHNISGATIGTNDRNFQITFPEDLANNGPNLKEIVDGCCDLRVVTTGTLSAIGVKDLQPQELVDANNLEKFKWTYPYAMEFCEKNEGHTWDQNPLEPTYAYVKNSDGKIIKPPSHKPPSLDKEIFRQEQKYGINSNKPLL